MAESDSERSQTPLTSKKIAHELFDACNAFKEDSKQWQRIAVAIQAAEEEIERLTRESEAWDKASLVAIIADRDRLTVERDQLLTAIGEHVTVRSDQYALIQRLTRERNDMMAQRDSHAARVAELRAGRENAQRINDKGASEIDRLRATLKRARERIAALDCYTSHGARDSGLINADISTEHVQAFRDRVLEVIDAALSGERSSAPETATELQMPAELLQFLWHRVIPKLEWSGNNLGIAGDERSYIDMANQLRGMIYAMGRPVRPHRSGGGTSSIPERSAPFIRKPTVYEIQSGACLCGTTDQSECLKHANSAVKASVCMGCNSTPCVCAELGSAQEAPACRSCGHVPAPGQQLTASGNCLVCEAL